MSVCGFLLVLTVCLSGVFSKDRGFELLYTSNPREYQDLPVKFQGTVPKWLKGRLIRNGCGLMEMGDRTFHHAFDCYAKLMSFELHGHTNGYFTTKFLNTKFYKQSTKQNSIAPYVLFDRPDPPFNIKERVAQLQNGIDNANVNVHAYIEKSNSTKQEFVAVSDFWQSYQFEPKTLSTVSHINPQLPSNYLLRNVVPLPSTSHPVKERGSNSYISFVSYISVLPMFPNYINVVRMNALDDVELIAAVETEKLPYMHALALSANYAILFADPLYIDAMSMLESAEPLNSLKWQPLDRTSVYVINLINGSVIDLKVPAMVHTHHVNSYESGDTLFVDYVAYPDYSFIKEFLISTLMNVTKRNSINPNAHLLRYEINLKKKTTKVRTFKKARALLEFMNKMDFPAINENYRFRKYCYIYGVVPKSDNVSISHMSLVKNDICGEGRDLAWHQEDHFVTEPVFVPSPTRVSEDDGVLLAVALDGRKGVSYLAILDARSLKMIGRGYVNDVIPFTLHGGFFPWSKL